MPARPEADKTDTQKRSPPTGGAADGRPTAVSASEPPPALRNADASQDDVATATQQRTGVDTPGARAHRTPWRHSLTAPVRAFLGTEVAGSFLLLLAIAAALVWSSSPSHASYFKFWSSAITFNFGGHVIGTELRGVVNEGLMTLFFLVVGLEAKRELDLGELRDRRRLTVPVIAGLSGIAASVLVYLAVTGASGAARGWGVAVSTDTALALGALTLITAGSATRIRVFLLTLLVVDDFVSLMVITFAYPSRIHIDALVTAGTLFALLLALREYGRRHQDDENSGAALFAISVLVGVGLWLALFESGIDPVITGLVIGLLTSAYAPKRADLERGTDLAHSFRIDPSPQRAHAATVSLTGAISPNERLQYRLHPWTSLMVVPIFALANAGLHIDPAVLTDALRSPITWGVIVAYTLGKPLGLLSAAWITAKGAPRRGKLPVSWRELVGTASSTGVAFTVSLLIASRAFSGESLADAKLGVLMTVLIAPICAVVTLKPLSGRAAETEETVPTFASDLVTEIDADEDHIRGNVDATVTVTVYASFGCRSSAEVAASGRELLERFPDQVRYVHRHLPLDDVLPGATLAAEATEAASAQGSFWDMHDALCADPAEIGLGRIYAAAHELDLDLDRFFTELGRHAYALRIARDVATADVSGVTGTPTIFLNGRRYDGALDMESLARVVERCIGGRMEQP